MSATMTIKILERKRAPAIHGEAEFAAIEVGGDVVHASKYDDEANWLVDAYFKKGWMPMFVHGFGSRCTYKRALTPEAAALLDAKEVSHVR